jgi:hypothetical protein
MQTGIDIFGIFCFGSFENPMVYGMLCIISKLTSEAPPNFFLIWGRGGPIGLKISSFLCFLASSKSLFIQKINVDAKCGFLVFFGASVNFEMIRTPQKHQPFI